MMADAISSGFRPALSTTNSDAILLTNCTPPTMIVAKCSLIVLPAMETFIQINSLAMLNAIKLTRFTEYFHGEENDTIDTTYLL